MVSESGGNEKGLPVAARWFAVAVLGSAGVLGVVRAWVVPTTMLEPGTRHSAQATAGDQDAPGADAPAPGSIGEPVRDPAPGSVARRINVNTASAAELELLPGIGPALAAMIIEDRKANGPYATLDDLDRVPRIGPKTVAKLAPFASVE